MKTPSSESLEVKGKAQPMATGLANFPNPLLRAIVALRAGALVALEPLDYLGRILNGKRDLPPLALRRYVGPLANLEASGAEFVAYLKLLCGATSESRILDIGCGFGLVAQQLGTYLSPPGKYVGLDINPAAIKWATQHISSRLPNFEFIHMDIRNGAYNPRGRQSADQFVFPMSTASFDIVLLKSVFTHLRPPEVLHYLKEITRLMGPKGVCLSTFFLLNEVQASYQARGLNAVDFRFGDDLWRYAFRDLPELAVAYNEKTLRSMVAEARLAVTDVHYGNWSGRAGGLSYQDVALLAASADVE
jgi:SAM-dependent methyltransferase